MARQDLDGNESGGVIGSDTPPDYAAVEIPGDKPPTEYAVEERRAAILDIITDLGHPSMLNQTELADRYGVTQPMIHKDINALAENVGDRVGEQHDLEIESVFRRSIRGLLNEGEWRKAARTASDYAEWMNDRVEIEELREEIEVLKEVTGAE